MFAAKDRLTHQWTVGSGKYWYVEIKDLGGDECVLGRRAERGVAGDRRDPDDRGEARCDQNGHDIVVTGIAVDPQLDRLGGGLAWFGSCCGHGSTVAANTHNRASPDRTLATR